MSLGRTKYTAVIAMNAKAVGLDPDLLEAQVIVESAGQPDAFRYEGGFYHRYIENNPSAKGKGYGPLAACSYGLLQIMLETAIELGFTDGPWRLFEPEIGVYWGAKYLAKLNVWAEGNIDRALAAYNGGQAGNVVVPYRNQGYVSKVRQAQKSLLIGSGAASTKNA